MELFGIHFVGVTAENGRKLLFTVAFALSVILLGRLSGWLAGLVLPGKRLERAEFWTRQGIRLLTALVLVVGLLSIWFNDPARLATAAGLVTAGVAFAMQRVITAFAAYFILLRGKTFNVGDRITMGGVRGDVIALDFIQTTIMEMGQPPGEQADAPAMWVHARQYTGRIATVTNDKIFDQPVYNYSREFPYIWEEMQLPISYKDDRKRAEEIMLEVAARHTVKISEMSEEALKEMERRYLMRRSELDPRVYWRLTDNWIELTVRFIAREHGVRDLKDRMSRDILQGLEDAKIAIASGTYEIVGFPPIRIEDRKQP
jgi:small-conductance mechanosensitive channel